ncbi:MAG: GNAT family N-acetyltransferase [Actinomycetota bacterium]
MTSQLALDKQVKIRQAEIKDAERIANLCEQLGYSVKHSQIEQCLSKIKEDDSHILYVASANESVIGWVQGHICDLIIAPTHLLILGLVVDRDYRQQGVGKLLVQQIEDWASFVGCEGVLVRSNIKRQEAHLFYEKIGYTYTKQQKIFYKALSNPECDQIDGNSI